VKPVLYNTKKRRLTMEIIIDCDNKGLAKAMADALSKQTGIARDKFKESSDDVDTSVDATRDQSGS
tara:strand:+ start:125 stop:322 length:198 start_codon:yes stop_codon:yes gene_type:complete